MPCASASILFMKYRLFTFEPAKLAFIELRIRSCMTSSLILIVFIVVSSLSLVASSSFLSEASSFCL